MKTVAGKITSVTYGEVTQYRAHLWEERWGWFLFFTGGDRAQCAAFLERAAELRKARLMWI